jgi:two-component system LytT family sensor kinase
MSRRADRMMLLLYGTSAGVGLHLGILHYFLLRFRGPRALLAPLVFVASSVVFSTVTWALWRWVFPRIRAATAARAVWMQTLVALAALGATSFVLLEVASLALGTPSLTRPPPPGDLHVVITPQMRHDAAILYALLPIVPSVLMALIGYHQYWRRILTLKDRERELSELAATAELAALRARINPHFLFNSLNSIAQLIHSDPATAEACVERLAEIFRYILRRGEKEFVPLADELQVTEAYLDLERARFGDRLVVETAVTPASLGRMIPTLTLQPLVENAIKHGLARKIGPGRVRIDAEVRDGCLVLSVGDDGLGMAGPALDSIYERGLGLSSLRDRLARLYGPAHLPEITSAPGQGTCVRLRLPDLPEAA